MPCLIIRTTYNAAGGDGKRDEAGSARGGQGDVRHVSCRGVHRGSEHGAGAVEVLVKGEVRAAVVKLVRLWNEKNERNTKMEEKQKKKKKMQKKKKCKKIAKK